MVMEMSEEKPETQSEEDVKEFFEKEGKKAIEEERKEIREREMIEEAIEAIALELSLKYPSLSFMERKIGGKPMTVVVKEIKDSIVVRVEVMSNEGELKKFEFEREQMREIEEMFDFP